MEMCQTREDAFQFYKQLKAEIAANGPYVHSPPATALPEL